MLDLMMVLLFVCGFGLVTLLVEWCDRQLESQESSR